MARSPSIVEPKCVSALVFPSTRRASMYPGEPTGWEAVLRCATTGHVVWLCQHNHDWRWKSRIENISALQCAEEAVQNPKTVIRVQLNGRGQK